MIEEPAKDSRVGEGGFYSSPLTSGLSKHSLKVRGASIRQTKRHQVPHLLSLHLLLVFHFIVVKCNVLNASLEIIAIIVIAVGYPKFISNGLKFITLPFDDAHVSAGISLS